MAVSVDERADSLRAGRRRGRAPRIGGMGTLYLVRHGQASLGSDDYDRLSELGTRQCAALGQWFAARGTRFAAVYTGTLRRHAQSLAALAEGHGALAAEPDAALHGLNEYDAEAVIRSVHPGPLARPTTPEAYRTHFRLLRDGLAAWMAGRAQPQGMPDWPAFRAGVARALEAARAHHDADVLMVSSGGPIATAVAQVLGAPDEAAIELNLRIRNSAVTELAFTPKRHMLVTYNTLPHLDSADGATLVTYT
jgi:broad specificity phosphatase PhoE